MSVSPSDTERASPSSQIPSRLDALLPECAKPCLRDFIDRNYPRQVSKDLPTLCARSMSSGYTLGEATLICQTSHCLPNRRAGEATFAICNDIPEAAIPTHSTLVVVPMATSEMTPGSDAFASALPASIEPPSETVVDVTAIASATGSPPTPTRSPREDSSTIESSTTTSASRSDVANATSTSGAIAPANSSSTRVSNTLSTGQIIGISMAALFALLVLAGLVLFLYLRKRRRNIPRRPSRWSMTEPKPSNFPPPGQPGLNSDWNAGPMTSEPSQRFYAPPTSQQQKRRSFWRRSIKPEDIGVAFAVDGGRPASPPSLSSQRTTSHLLPSLPGSANFSRSLRKPANITPSAAPVPEPARKKVKFPSTLVDTGAANESAPAVFPGVAATASMAGCTYGGRAGAVNNGHDRIPLTPVYDNGNIPATFGEKFQPGPHPPSPKDHPYPMPLRPTIDSRAKPAASLPSHQGIDRSLPPLPSLATSANARSSREPPVRRNSSSSDCTHFEDEENTTPDHERIKQLQDRPLSPVMESPRRSSGSAASALGPSASMKYTYPSPPRSAAVRGPGEKHPKPPLQPAVNFQSRRHGAR